MKKIVKIIVGAAAFGMIAGTTFQGVTYTAENLLETGSSQIESEKTTDASTTKLSTTNVVTSSSTGTTDVSEIAEQVLPSIVAIDVTEETTAFNPFYGEQTTESTGSGSGIIIAEKDNKLYIATNNHVVEGAKTVTIKFNDESTASAQIKGTDSSTDLAVVVVDESELKEDTLNHIKVAVIGDSSQTKVGEQAIAIGNALGFGTSVTVGYVSAKDREIDSEDSESVKLIQTDAAINPGNSGGALVNSSGEVIGINSSKFASEEVEGMGFAIPMATAEPILTELMNEETIAKEDQAYLGITGQDVTSEYAQYYNMPEGIYVASVSEGSPAESAGIKKGYIITGINGTKVTTLEALQEKLAKCKAGSEGTVTVKVADNGEYVEKEIKVTFGKKAQAN